MKIRVYEIENNNLKTITAKVHTRKLALKGLVRWIESVNNKVRCK